MSDAQPIETWKDIEGFPGYQISDQGNVRSRHKKGRRPHHPETGWRPLRLARLPTGYRFVCLFAGGKMTRRYIHHLVLEAFVGPRPAGMQARHVGVNDRSDNRLANLAWGTLLENRADMVRHGTRPKGSDTPSAKLNDGEVAEILADAARGVAIKDLAARHGIRKENVSKIVNGHHWRHVDGERRRHEASVSGHVTTAEAAVTLSLTRARVQQLIRAGRLVAIRYRKGWLVEESSVRAATADRSRRLG